MGSSCLLPPVLLFTDIETYYDIRATEFIYFGGGRWIRSRNFNSIQKL
jgi:hypothetical protein